LASKRLARPARHVSLTPEPWRAVACGRIRRRKRRLVSHGVSS